MTPAVGDRVRVFLTHPKVAGLDGQLGSEYPEFGGEVVRVVAVIGDKVSIIDDREPVEPDEGDDHDPVDRCGVWSFLLAGLTDGEAWSRRLEVVAP